MRTNFGNRHQDPQLCRFWGLDRFAEKYFSLTPFHYAANNPMLFVDVNGDSTMYYDSRGNHLFTAQDSKSEHYLTVISDEHLPNFNYLPEGISDDIKHSSGFNSYIRGTHGASYDLNEIVAFKKGEKERQSSLKDINGANLINEKSAKLSLNSSTKIFDFYDIAVGDYGSAPGGNGLPTIHTHDNVGKEFMPNASKILLFRDGTSGDDEKEALKTKQHYYNVVVSEKSIIFYRNVFNPYTYGNDHYEITINLR